MRLRPMIHHHRCMSVVVTGDVHYLGKARTSEVSCERTFFITLRDIEEAITVAVKQEICCGCVDV